MTAALRLSLLIAAGLALAISRRRRDHAPLAILLLATVALDALAEVCSMPPQLDLLLYLMPSALSAWCAQRVLGRTPSLHAALLSSAIVIWPLVAACASPAAWPYAPLGAHTGALAVQLLAARDWWHSGRLARISELCALALAAGDAAALLGPVGIGGPWWVATANGLIVAAALICLQAAEIRSVATARRGARFPTPAHHLARRRLA
jgi:hypothetical protein